MLHGPKAFSASQFSIQFLHFLSFVYLGAFLRLKTLQKFECSKKLLISKLQNITTSKYLKIVRDSEPEIFTRKKYESLEIGCFRKKTSKLGLE